MNLRHAKTVTYLTQQQSEDEDTQHPAYGHVCVLDEVGRIRVVANRGGQFGSEVKAAQILVAFAIIGPFATPDTFPTRQGVVDATVAVDHINHVAECFADSVRTVIGRFT